MKKINFYALIAFVLLFTSCTATLRLAVEKPAEAKLPDNIERFGVINFANEDDSGRRQPGNNATNTNTITANGAIIGITQSLVNREGFNAVYIPDSLIRGLDGSIYSTKIDSIAKAQGLQAYFIINDVKTVMPLGGTILASAIGQTSARIDGTLFFSVEVIDTNLKFNNLSVKHFNSIPLSGGLSIQDIFLDKERKRIFYNTLGIDLGVKAAQMISPNWIWLDRTYYTKGNNAIKRSIPMMFDGNWVAAEETLLKDDAYEKEKVRSRVLFNLAVIKEGQGDLNAAIAYIDRAIDEGGGDLCKQYLKTLEERQFQLLNQ